jgi:hypothetical protein
LQLADQLTMTAQGKLGLDPVFQDGQAALLQPHHLTLAAAGQGDVGRGRPPPQPQRLSQQPCRPGRVTGGQRRPTLAGQPLERGQVELLGAEVAQVAGRPCAQQATGRPPGLAGLQDLAEVGHVDLQAVPGGLGAVLAPQLVDQPLDRHHPAGVQQQHGQEGPLLGAAKRQPLALGVQGLQRAENPELHRAAPSWRAWCTAPGPTPGGLEPFLSGPWADVEQRLPSFAQSRSHQAIPGQGGRRCIPVSKLRRLAAQALVVAVPVLLVVVETAGGRLP